MFPFLCADGYDAGSFAIVRLESDCIIVGRNDVVIAVVIDPETRNHFQSFTIRCVRFDCFNPQVAVINNGNNFLVGFVVIDIDLVQMILPVDPYRDFMLACLIADVKAETVVFAAVNVVIDILGIDHLAVKEDLNRNVIVSVILIPAVCTEG